MHLVFAVIARREVSFYLAVADDLLARGLASRVSFISYYQPGNAAIAARGYPVVDIYERVDRILQRGAALDPEARAAADKARRYLYHEHIDQRTSFADLERKMQALLAAHLEVLDELQGTAALQELNGFVAPLSLMMACALKGVRHVFFEPSLYSGRLYYVESIAAHKPTARRGADPTFTELLRGMRERYAPAMPAKDRHHFMDMGLAKVLQPRNLAAFRRKVVERYWRRERQEYDNVWLKVGRNARALFNRFANSPQYQSLESIGADEKLVYVPLHVSNDFALTVRSPEYHDQLAVIRRIAMLVPSRTTVAIKEHPASVGDVGFMRLRALRRTCPNVVLLKPSTPSDQVIERADAVVTINSKVGAEALLRGKPVIVLGDAFYRNHPLATPLEGLSGLPGALERILYRKPSADPDAALDFWWGAWLDSWPGELYVESPENVRAFADSLARYLG